jgi:ribosomal protein S12 methylthiotransferase
VGQTLEVIIDEIDEEDGVLIGRTKADAPEIDGHVYINGDHYSAKPGERINVTITAADTYDLYVGIDPD